MKYFFDTEFIEDGKTIELISIGIVAEDGREYYACNSECDLDKANQWVKENVIPLLPPRSINLSDPSISPTQKEESLRWKTKATIRREIVEFTLNTDPEFWAYFADYDWVVFCQLFGAMIDLPSTFPQYCRDLKQEADRLSVSLEKAIPQKDEHNAIADARWCKDAWNYLLKMKR